MTRIPTMGGWGREGRNVSKGVDAPGASVAPEVTPQTSTMSLATKQIASHSGLQEVMAGLRAGLGGVTQLVKAAMADKPLTPQEKAALGAAGTAGENFGDVIGEQYKNNDLESYGPNDEPTTTIGDDLQRDLDTILRENPGDEGQALVTARIQAQADKHMEAAGIGDWDPKLQAAYREKFMNKLMPAIIDWHGARNQERRVILGAGIVDRLIHLPIPQMRPEMKMRAGRDANAFITDMMKDPAFQGIPREDVSALVLAGAAGAMALNTKDGLDKAKFLLDAMPDGMLAEDQAKMVDALHGKIEDYNIGEIRMGLGSITADTIKEIQAAPGIGLGKPPVFNAPWAMTLHETVVAAGDDAQAVGRIIDTIKAWNADAVHGGGNLYSHGDRLTVLHTMMNAKVVIKVDGQDQSVPMIDPDSLAGTEIRSLALNLPNVDEALEATLTNERKERIYTFENAVIQLGRGQGPVEIDGVTISDLRALEAHADINYPNEAGHLTYRMRQARDLKEIKDTPESRRRMAGYEDKILYGEKDEDSGEMITSDDQRDAIRGEINELYFEGKMTLEERDRLVALGDEMDDLGYQIRQPEFLTELNSTTRTFWSAAGAEITGNGDVLRESNWALPDNADPAAAQEPSNIRAGMTKAWVSWLRNNRDLAKSNLGAYEAAKTAFLGELGAAWNARAQEIATPYSPGANEAYYKWFKNVRAREDKIEVEPWAKGLGYDYRALFNSGWKPPAIEIKRDDKGKRLPSEPLELPDKHAITQPPTPEEPEFDGINLITGAVKPKPKEDKNND